MRRIGTRFLATLVAIAAASAAIGTWHACAQDGEYLPLEAGAQWELHSSAVSQPMILSVESLQPSHSGNGPGQAARVDWQNPWVRAAFVFHSVGKRVFLEGLDMGSGTAAMPDGTTYFQFDSPKGTQWSNSVGSFLVASTDTTAKAPAGTFAHCIEIVATDTHGSKTYWYFAPGVGFVQFGEGASAFFLTRHSAGSATARAPAGRQGVPAKNIHPPEVVPIREGGLYLGLESNAAVAQGSSFEARQQSAAMSAQAGSRLVFVCPKWEEIEPSPGQYNFTDVDERVRIAKQTGSVILLNLRLIDTSRKTAPAAYRDWDWDDQRLEAKVGSAYQALAQHLEGRARWVTVGNEVDTYFSSHRREIEPYARMLRAITPGLRRDFPNTPIAVNFTTTAAGDLQGKFSEITNQTDVYSLNYYPINANFTFRDPSTCTQELQTILNAASAKPIVFQEMGYPSSTRLGSSEDKQAQFLGVVLQVVGANRGRVQAVNFNWRSDLPDSVVRDLTKYYKLNDSENFREFLATLGWFHQDNTPKKIWYVFQKQAPAFVPGR
jgi:hypothetical protein